MTEYSCSIALSGSLRSFPPIPPRADRPSDRQPPLCQTRTAGSGDRFDGVDTSIPVHDNDMRTAVLCCLWFAHRVPPRLTWSTTGGVSLGWELCPFLCSSQCI